MYKIYSKRTGNFIATTNTLQEALDYIDELELLDHNNGVFYPNNYKYYYNNLKTF